MDFHSTHTSARMICALLFVLSNSDLGLKVADLAESIRTHLEEHYHPELRDNLRINSIFASKRQQTTQSQPHDAPDNDSPVAKPPSPTPQIFHGQMFPIAYARSLAYRKHPNCERKWFFDATPSCATDSLPRREYPASSYRFPSSYSSSPYNPVGYQFHNTTASIHHATISNRKHYT